MPAPHRKPAPSRPRLPWIIAGLLILFVMISASFVRETLRSRQIDGQIAALKSEAESLRAKNFEILSMQSSLGQSEFFEKEARTKLGLQKEGEQVVVLRKDGAAGQAGAAPRLPKGADWSNLKKWWMYFADRGALEAYAARR